MKVTQQPQPPVPRPSFEKQSAKTLQEGDKAKRKLLDGIPLDSKKEGARGAGKEKNRLEGSFNKKSSEKIKKFSEKFEKMAEECEEKQREMSKPVSAAKKSATLGRPSQASLPVAATGTLPRGLPNKPKMHFTSSKTSLPDVPSKLSSFNIPSKSHHSKAPSKPSQPKPPSKPSLPKPPFNSVSGKTSEMINKKTPVKNMAEKEKESCGEDKRAVSKSGEPPAVAKSKTFGGYEREVNESNNIGNAVKSKYNYEDVEVADEGKMLLEEDTPVERKNVSSRLTNDVFTFNMHIY